MDGTKSGGGAVGFFSRIGAGFRNIGGFFGDVWSELKKVRWPNRKELTTYTVVVLTTVLLLAIFIYVIDLGISTLVTRFLR